MSIHIYTNILKKVYSLYQRSDLHAQTHVQMPAHKCEYTNKARRTSTLYISINTFVHMFIHVHIHMSIHVLVRSEGQVNLHCLDCAV